MTRATSFVQWKRLDARLHRGIAEASHNSVLLMLYDTLRTQVKISLDVRMEEVFGAEAGPQGATDGEHREFLDAIKYHQPERAEQAMRDHLKSVRTKLFGLR
jgi:DNA-binding FadR family transcriptional regulator